MRVGAVSSLDVMSERARPTGRFHLSEDQRAVARLKRLTGKTVPLSELCVGRRLFRGPIL